MHTNIDDETKTSRDCDLGKAPVSEAKVSGGNTKGTKKASILPVITNSIPTFLVMGLLVAVGYLGHHYGWKIPEFSELAGRSKVNGVQWCEEHGVAEPECIACNAELMPKPELFGWCKEHGVHECVLHHPEASQLAEIPIITDADFKRAAEAIALRPRTKNDPACKMHLRRIQFSSTEAADKAGIDIGLVDRGRITETVAATGEIIYDPTRVAHLGSRAAGTVWRVNKNVGDIVNEGDVLALIDAAEVGRAKAELLQAVAQLRLHDEAVKRLDELEGVVAGKLVLEARAARAEAKAAAGKSVQVLHNLGLQISFERVYPKSDNELQQQLHFLGLPSAISSQLDAARTTANLIPLIASRKGIVVARDAVAGEVVATDRKLFTIADTSVMWLMLNIPLEEARRVAVGQEIVFQTDGDEQPYTGELTWISTAADDQTRTIKVRGELANADGQLRHETFGSGQIVLRDDDDAIIVPSSAVHWEGCCHVVFVRNKDYFNSPYKVFHTRSVRPGAVSSGMTEMIAGLLPGEVIVTKGSGVLRAELLKGNLGAG